MTPSVTLLDSTGNPVRAMALAARLCYTQGMDIAHLDQSLTDERCQELVKKIISNRHLSVLEHATFMFGVEGVSRNFSHQLVRHRNTSYEQQSLHYTLAPDSIEVAMPAGLSGSQRARWGAVKDLCHRVYREMVAEGVPREEARHLLPSGVETKLVMSANLRQWLHFVEVRACVVNCHEITVVAQKVKHILEEKIPFLKEVLGPTCWTSGTCHEGKKFCGTPWKDECRVDGDGIEPYTFVRAREVR